MSWYALEEIDEAISETKDMLLPFDLGMWSKLALIVFLTGSGFNMPSGTGGNYPSQDYSGGEYDFGNFDSTQLPESSTHMMDQPPADFSNMMTGMASAGVTSAVIAVVIAVMLLIGLPLMFLSSIFEFIFYQSLIDKDVKIRKNFSEHFWKGARYFGFQLVYILAFLGVIGLAAAALMISNAAFLLGVLLALPIVFVLGIFSGLTHDFVLLRMMEADEKLIEAWKSFWPTLKEEWRQVAVYLVVKFLIGLFIGIAAAIVMLIIVVLLLIPFGIFTVILSMISEALIFIPVVIGLLTLFITVLYVAVPFRVFVYYFVILVYHDLIS
jgi:hypothetical protein